MEKDRNKPNRIYLAFQIISWILAAFFLFIFLKNSGWLPSTPTTIYDLAYLMASFIFFVLPFISHLKLGQIEFSMLKLVEGVSEGKPKPATESKPRLKTVMELKILNTLWKRQMLRFPELNKTWMFKLTGGGTPEADEFKEASNRLIWDGLISETGTDHFLRITTNGLRYCAKNHETFPTDMCVKDVEIPDENRIKFFDKLKQDRLMQ